MGHFLSIRQDYQQIYPQIAQMAQMKKAKRDWFLSFLYLRNLRHLWLSVSWLRPKAALRKKGLPPRSTGPCEPFGEEILEKWRKTGAVVRVGCLFNGFRLGRVRVDHAGQRAKPDLADHRERYFTDHISRV